MYFHVRVSLKDDTPLDFIDKFFEDRFQQYVYGLETASHFHFHSRIEYDHNKNLRSIILSYFKDYKAFSLKWVSIVEEKDKIKNIAYCIKGGDFYYKGYTNLEIEEAKEYDTSVKDDLAKKKKEVNFQDKILKEWLTERDNFLKEHIQITDRIIVNFVVTYVCEHKWNYIDKNALKRLSRFLIYRENPAKIIKHFTNEVMNELLLD